MNAVSAENGFDDNSEQTQIDARIVYPSYKSFDEFIDVERLRSLDGYITERINEHIKSEKDDYFLNLHRLDENSPYQPGVREIWLSRPKTESPDDYLDLDKTDLWQPTEAAAEFSELMKFIETLPFKATGRMLIIYDDSGREVPAHRDHLNIDLCNEFVWFRTNRVKPFYVLNEKTNEKRYVESYSAWFDAVNQFHGSEAANGLSFSIRVDGVFSDELKAQIPHPVNNRASTPALWEALEKQKI